MTQDPHRAAATSQAAPSKIAIVRSLLDTLMGNAPVDATVILSNTHGGSNSEGAQATGKIPSLVLAGRSLEALAACHTALCATDQQSLQSVLRPKIAELRKALEHELLTAQDIDLVSATGRTHLLPRRSVLIGRPSSEKTVDVAVNCRWFSRGDRNLSLFCEGAGWFVEDIGSTNGSFVQGQALKPGHPLALPVGETRIEVGAAKDATALAVVHIHRPAKDPGAVVITLSGVPASANSQPDPWPSMQDDIKRRWVVFREQIGVSAAEDCALRVDGDLPGIIAAIRYQSGFWVVPSSQCTSHIDDIVFRESVPLAIGANLTLGGTRLRVEQQMPASSIAIGAANQQHLRAG